MIVINHLTSLECRYWSSSPLYWALHAYYYFGKILVKDFRQSTVNRRLRKIGIVLYYANPIKHIVYSFLKLNV